MKRPVISCRKVRAKKWRFCSPYRTNPTATSGLPSPGRRRIRHKTTPRTDEGEAGGQGTDSETDEDARKACARVAQIEPWRREADEGEHRDGSDEEPLCAVCDRRRFRTFQQRAERPGGSWPRGPESMRRSGRGEGQAHPGRPGSSATPLRRVDEAETQPTHADENKVVAAVGFPEARDDGREQQTTCPLHCKAARR